VSLGAGRLFASAGSGRLDLEVGSIKNANDFAAHLLLVTPFLLWVALGSRSLVLRLAAFLGVGCGVYFILRTASRGAVIALALDVAFFLWRGTARQRIAFLALAPIAATVLLAAVPRDAWLRIETLWSSATANGFSVISEEVAGSTSIRQYVFQKSVSYALQHPLFGVGPGMFADYEGSSERKIGTHGYYKVAHNTFAQVASECGFPALLFFVAGIVSTLHLLSVTLREARRRPDCRDISIAAFCVMLGMIGFCTAATFLSLAYSFYLPAMGGLAIAISRAAKQEFASRPAVAGMPLRPGSIQP
jgi:O-antigen ligase